MPTDLNLLKSQMEVDNKLKLAKFELTEVVEVKTTADESMAFINAWRTYLERMDCLVRSRGKCTPWCLVSVPQSCSTR